MAVIALLSSSDITIMQRNSFMLTRIVPMLRTHNLHLVFNMPITLPNLIQRGLDIIKWNLAQRTNN